MPKRHENKECVAFFINGKNTTALLMNKDSDCKVVSKGPKDGDWFFWNATALPRTNQTPAPTVTPRGPGVGNYTKMDGSYKCDAFKNEKVIRGKPSVQKCLAECDKAKSCVQVMYKKDKTECRILVPGKPCQPIKSATGKFILYDAEENPRITEAPTKYPTTDLITAKPTTKTTASPTNPDITAKPTTKTTGSPTNPDPSASPTNEPQTNKPTVKGVTSSPTPAEGLGGGAVAGIAIAAVAGVAIVAIGANFLMKKGTKPDMTSRGDASKEMELSASNPKNSVSVPAV